MSISKTSLTLLESLRNPADQTAWQRFDAGYRPMLTRFAAQLGLDPNEAEESAQRALTKFCSAYQRGQYDRTKGRFKNWLLTIARNEIADLCNERARHPATAPQRSSATDVLAQLRDPKSLSDLWDAQWHAHVLRQCLDHARTQFTARDITIFENLTLHERSVDDVATQFNLSPDAVRQIRHRVLRFLRSIKDQFHLDLDE